MAKAIVTQVEFKVRDKMVIADPCYIDGDDKLSALGDLGIILEGCAGDWVASVEFNDQPSDRRVSILRATRRDAYDTGSRTWEHIGDNGVDSGQMFIGDVANFPLNYEALLERYKLPNGEWNNDLNFFDFKEGAVSSTGYGDGCYPVYIKRDSQGKPWRIEVRFLSDEDEYANDEN